SPLHPLIVSKTFGRLANRAGLPPLTFHSLRHSWATNALAARVNIKTVSTRLGHSSIRVTLDIYVEPSDDDDQGAADTVANLYDAI
ncbi:MAG: tyrosine-type recombinase/integrase, partial [Ilumatobacter sp.]|nr:tyrosine-type recombinase/integrase [Ilumatobacter sp.]